MTMAPAPGTLGEGKLVSLEDLRIRTLKRVSRGKVAVATKHRGLQPPCFVSKCARVAKKANLGTFLNLVFLADCGGGLKAPHYFCHSVPRTRGTKTSLIDS
jgi:hypothetical protein